jgi:hypothetical protein
MKDMPVVSTEKDFFGELDLDGDGGAANFER